MVWLELLLFLVVFIIIIFFFFFFRGGGTYFRHERIPSINWWNYYSILKIIHWSSSWIYYYYVIQGLGGVEGYF